MHEWEITTVWGAITSPKSVRVRWHYLAGWEPLLNWGFLAPEEWGEVNYCGGNGPFGPCLWHEDISLESEGLKCSKATRHEALRDSFLFDRRFLLQRWFIFMQRLLKVYNSELKAACIVVEMAQGIIYFWSGNWLNISVLLRHTCYCRWPWIMRVIKSHLYNICGQKAHVKFYFLWWCFYLPIGSLWALLGCVLGSTAGQGRTEEWQQPLWGLTNSRAT